MKTKTFYLILAGICFMLFGMKSSALPPCTFTITVDAWTLNISDTATGYTYTCSGQVLNSDGVCYSSVYNYGAVYASSSNSMPQHAYTDCEDYNYHHCVYYFKVVVQRSDGAYRVFTTTGQIPDISYHISVGTINVKFY